MKLKWFSRICEEKNVDILALVCISHSREGTGLELSLMEWVHALVRFFLGSWGGVGSRLLRNIFKSAF